MLLQKQPPASHIGKQTRGLAAGHAVPTPVKASQRSNAAPARPSAPPSAVRVYVASASRGSEGQRERRERRHRPQRHGILARAPPAV